MDNEKMTIKEVLEITAKNLREIMLPVELSDIGQIIHGSIQNLDACMKAMKEAEKAVGGDKDGRADPE